MTGHWIGSVVYSFEKVRRDEVAQSGHNNKGHSGRIKRSSERQLQVLKGGNNMRSREGLRYRGIKRGLLLG